MASKKNLKALEMALERAAALSIQHGDAVQDAVAAFEKAFKQEVPEECFSICGGDSKNMAGSLFNDFVNHGENLSGQEGVEGLVLEMQKLMKVKE